MQKWEYLYVNRWRGIERKKGQDVLSASKWNTLKPNTEMDGEEWSGEFLALLNELGDRGWELISVTPGSGCCGGVNPLDISGDADGISSYGVTIDVAGFTNLELWTFKRPKE